RGRGRADGERGGSHQRVERGALDASHPAPDHAGDAGAAERDEAVGIEEARGEESPSRLAEDEGGGAAVVGEEIAEGGQQPGPECTRRADLVVVEGGEVPQQYV